MHGTGAPLGRFTKEVPTKAKEGASNVARVLKSAQRILILGHAGADGDVAGSSLGLACALRGLGKTVTVYNEEPLSPIFDFLPGASKQVDFVDDNAKFDATVVVDAARTDRLGKHFPQAERRGSYCWVDHHRIDEPPGDVNYIDLTAAAVGEQIAEILDAMGIEFTRDVASCLYASLMTDTGAFRYGNTTARAFRLAARLVAAGCEPWEMTQALYESQAESRVRLLGKALTTLERTCKGELGVLQVHDEDLTKADATERDVHGIVNHVRGIRGVELAVLVRGNDDACRVIFRSRGNVNVQPIAEKLGGKGSMNAGKVMLSYSVGEGVKQVQAAVCEVLCADVNSEVTAEDG
ncbi:MAG: bifunctional oligoribonuclease/PAP phosphatase NrnA [Deltaproteobacteria bacterium]|nr:bifunctional oligoribonuclease/PAP phosphatase NrnA [Deltaproteobacteria bacterium]